MTHLVLDVDIVMILDRWTHLGAVSWGEFCEEERYTPGIFASTINMREWVMETMENN